MKHIVLSLLKSLMAFIAYALGVGLVLGLFDIVFRDPGSFSMNILECIACMVGGTGAIFVMRRILDKKSILSLGFIWQDREKGKCYGNDILWGGLIGIVLIITGTAFLAGIGSINITGTSFMLKDTAGLFLLYIGVAIGEETCFRGYILSNLLDCMNKYVALTISAILFSLPHLMNPNPSLMSFIGIFLAGLVLGAAFIYTRNLWLPIGFHITWNFTQAMAGFNVSGTDTPHFLIIDYPKYDIINGGEFGFEASLVCAILIAITTAIIIWHFRANSVSSTH